MPKKLKISESILKFPIVYQKLIKVLKNQKHLDLSRAISRTVYENVFNKNGSKSDLDLLRIFLLNRSEEVLKHLE